jgi:hypothetical protein
MKTKSYDTENQQQKLSHFDVSFPQVLLPKGSYDNLYMDIDHNIVYLQGYMKQD